MSKKEQPSRLCPFKKIIEREFLGTSMTRDSDKEIFSECFAPCDGEQCMAYYKVGTREMCRRLEAEK